MSIIYFDTIDSTNTYALANLENLHDRDLIVSKEQLIGKGRNSKIWHSPKKGNIYATYIVKNYQNILLQSSWIGGLAALETLREISGLNNLWIKWPNDVFCDSKKICGVLCESVISSNSSNNGKVELIIGIGINLNCSQDDLTGIPKACTSVFIETGKENNLEKAYKLLKNKLDYFYEKILTEGADSLYKIWKKENQLLGKRITVEMSPDKIHEIKVLDIDQNGAIIGLNNENDIITIYSGDVSVKQF